jgi:FkbM family methyltransferase
MLLRVARSAARAAVESSGYWFRRSDQLPWGIDFLLDLRRLALAWGQPIKRVLDVGAHHGETIERILRAFPKANVIAFEPHPATFAVLAGRFGHDSRVTLHNIALDAERRTAELFEYPASTISSLFPNARYAAAYEKLTGSVSVTCAPLDDELFTDAIDVLKIDTEGNELRVLQGASKLLARRAIRFIYLEFNDLLEKPGYTGGALLPIAEFLGPFGFQFVATYTDYIKTNGALFGVSNVLLAAPPTTA